MAAAVACKKLSLADLKDAERITGFLVGGISPIAQKKRLKTIIDASAEQLVKVYVSAGRRGVDIGLAPHDLSQLLGAAFVDVLDE